MDALIMACRCADQITQYEQMIEELRGKIETQGLSVDVLFSAVPLQCIDHMGKTDALYPPPPLRPSALTHHRCSSTYFVAQQRPLR